VSASQQFPDADSTGALVARAAGGDERAFARLVRLNHVDLVRATFVATGDEDLASAAALAAWLAAWGRLRRLRDPEQLPAWLATIAAGEAASIAKRRQATGGHNGLAQATREAVELRKARASTMDVRRVDPDEVARAARMGADNERARRISVAVSAVIGALVAAAPWLLPALHR
jgi:DNA-directed RNA polymerase specialized sigma24 family protein